MWLGIILSFLLYSRNGYVYGLTTQRSNGEVIETDIKKDVNVMKSSFHELLKRVINNENEISVLESQTQYLGSELENIRRHYSCQIDGIHENNLQIRDEFHKSRSQLVTATDSINETMQELSHTVDLLDKKYLLLENIARQKSEENLNKSVNESGVCSSNPCRNGGICKAVRESYSCKCLSGYSGQQCQDSGYFDYVIMFTEPPRDDNIPRLYIHSSKSGSISIYSKADKNRTLALSSGTNQIDLPNSVFTKDEISNKAIHVHSTVPIVMYGFITDVAVDGYLAIPSLMLGDKYIVPTYKPSKHEDLRKCLLGVISVETNTHIQIKFKIPSTGTEVKYNHKSFGDGDTLSIILNELQTLQISHIYDLSGSIVTSNKPVGVVSGNKCNAINNFYCNAFIEMVLPVNQLTTQFITPTIARRNDSKVRVYAHEDTELKISTLRQDYSVHVDKEHFYEVESSHVSVINANENVLVVSFPKDIPDYDAYMMTIPGIQHYKSYYNFTVPAGYTSFISVTCVATKMKSQHDFLMN
ncbi:unnamed protein product [Mytilus edulis]|uniref:EGF-like domain-containing protein n=1 Tax=Mytilus edulis TaxID=6550 RepID=A0A8S3QED3_MYTED|nr:unnamed protein product [Mytilus edulis]